MVFSYRQNFFFRAFLFFATGLVFSACRKNPEPPRTEEVLGTVCSVNAFEDGTAAVYDAVFACLRQVDSAFNAHNAESEVSAITAAAGDHPVSVSEPVFFVLQTALRIAALTDGAFDPTIGPLVSLWGIATDHARVPTDAEIAEAKAFVNYHNCVLSEKDTSVFLTQKGMSLDLGGIAKGYAADALVSLLRAKKVTRAVIDLGGNIYVFGKKAGSAPWRVGIKDPENPLTAPALALSLQENAAVTSGVYERFFMHEGTRYHHILDAQTGFPAQSGLLSVTVVHSSSLLADALSTAFFVLGSTKALPLAKELGVSALFITNTHRVQATDDIADHLEILHEAYWQ